MTSDYTRFRQENIREYGEGTRHLSFLQPLYADRTRFTLELLQNAEDARVTRVSFVLLGRGRSMRVASPESENRQRVTA